MRITVRRLSAASGPGRAGEDGFGASLMFRACLIGCLGFIAALMGVVDVCSSHFLALECVGPGLRQRVLKQGRRDLQCKVLLNLDQVGDIAIVGLRPQMKAIGRAQLRRRVSSPQASAQTPRK